MTPYLKNRQTKKISDLIQEDLGRTARVHFVGEGNKVEKWPRSLSKCPTGRELTPGFADPREFSITNPPDIIL